MMITLNDAYVMTDVSLESLRAIRPRNTGKGVNSISRPRQFRRRDFASSIATFLR